MSGYMVQPGCISELRLARRQGARTKSGSSRSNVIAWRHGIACTPIRIVRARGRLMTRDALLAYAHFMCIFALASLLFSELVILRRILPSDLLSRLQLIDRWYGIAAALVILSGLARLFLGVKGPEFYGHNPVFWTKMTLFAAVGITSIFPTIAYLAWNKRRQSDGSIVLSDAEFTRTRRLIWLQVGLFVFIPLCATFMARGL